MRAYLASCLQGFLVESRQVERRKKALLERALKMDVYRDILVYERSARLDACTILFYILFSCVSTVEEFYKLDPRVVAERAITLDARVLRSLSERLTRSLRALIFKVAQYRETEEFLTSKPFPNQMVSFWSAMIGTY